MISDANAPAFGDIVLVPFPFTNQVSVKRRPAVVISSAAYNEGGPDIILMAITSRLREDQQPRDVVLTEWAEAGLLKASAVKPIIGTFERSLVLRRIGSLRHTDRERLRRLLTDLLG